jgi:hypothetical protein
MSTHAAVWLVLLALTSAAAVGVLEDAAGPAGRLLADVQCPVGQYLVFNSSCPDWTTTTTTTTSTNTTTTTITTTTAATTTTTTTTTGLVS